MQGRIYWFGIVTLLLCMSSAITLTVLLSPVIYGGLLYVFPRIMRETNLTMHELWQNYMVLYRYLIIVWQPTLKFPSFVSSPQGLQHFAEVRQLMWGNVGVMLVLGLYVRGIAWEKIRQVNEMIQVVWRQLMIVVICFIPVLVLAFRPLFIGFHRLVFRNDYWLFDPRLDPVIFALPTELFLVCAVSILVIGLVFIQWLKRRLALQ